MYSDSFLLFGRATCRFVMRIDGSLKYVTYFPSRICQERSSESVHEYTFAVKHRTVDNMDHRLARKSEENSILR